MIDLYTGTPGSGKSLHLANKILWAVRMGRYVVVNFPVYLTKNLRKRSDHVIHIENCDLNMQILMDISHDLSKKLNRDLQEDEILLIIDECQIMFNARDWGQQGRADWVKFFTQHRKLGYHVILVCQFDMMLDKQLRALVEYQHIHRKVSNFGWRGWFLCIVMLSPKLFIDVVVWYPMREKVNHEFFRLKKSDARIYDTRSTFSMFASNDQESEYLTPFFDP